MDPIKLECTRLAIQAGAGTEVLRMAREIEGYLTSSSPDSREQCKDTQRKHPECSSGPSENPPH